MIAVKKAAWIELLKDKNELAGANRMIYRYRRLELAIERRTNVMKVFRTAVG